MPATITPDPDAAAQQWKAKVAEAQRLADEEETATAARLASWRDIEAAEFLEEKRARALERMEAGIRSLGA